MDPRTTAVTRKGMGGHQSAAMKEETWLTPPWVIQRLGPFDLDPCAALNQPWDTANKHYTLLDDGLKQPWSGRVWLNPPYGKKAGEWLKRLADHGDGIALIFARTETDMFFRSVWDRADALLFLQGRIHFHHIDGSKAKANSGAPSVLIAYGRNNASSLEHSHIPGQYIDMKRNAA